MKKLRLIKQSNQQLPENCFNSVLQFFTKGKSLLLILTAMASIVTSCKKDDEAPVEDLIKASTSLRLVHSSYRSSASAVDLFVDDAKLNASTPLQFSNSSNYFPMSSGSRKITVKSVSGTTLADTVINIGDGKQYSLFIKDRSWLTEGAAPTVVPMNTHLIAVVDNSTSAPSSGKAKVRFVNMDSMPLNTTNGWMTYLTINPLGSPTPSTVITQNLGQDLRTFGSEYSSFDAGQITFRAQSISPSIVDLTTTLEAGKLYTLYVTSTEHLIRTPTKSPISLRILVNN